MMTRTRPVLIALLLATGCGDSSAQDGGEGEGETDDGVGETDGETGGDTGPHTGEALWTRTHDGPASGLDAAYGVIADSLGNVIVVGMHEDTAEAGGRNIWIRKYSGAGDELWTQTENGPAGADDFAFGVASDGDDNLIVVGGWATVDDDRNIWIRKYSAEGDTLWTRAVDGPAGAFDNANGVDVDADANVIVVGRWTDVGDNVNAWARKYSAGGDVVWTRTYDGPDGGFDAAVDVATLTDASVVIAGRETANGDSDMWIRRYDADGTELWTQTYDGGAGDDMATGAAVDGEGNIWISGRVQVTAGTDDSDVWVSKYSADGTLLWTVSHAGPSSGLDIAHGVDTHESGNAFVVGRETDLASGGENIWVRKYSASGDELWTNVYDGPAGDVDIASEVAVGFGGNVFVAGQHTDTVGGVDVWISKYSPFG